MEFSLADSYRAAGISPGPDILRLRSEPFENLRKALNEKMAVDLSRMYFGLKLPDTPDWFREPFAANDPSFSLYDNQREAAVLAVALLSAGLADRKFCAGLAPLAAGALGLRQPVVLPDFLEFAAYRLSEFAVNARKRAAANVSNIKLPVKSKMITELEAFKQEGGWPKTADMLKQASDEAYEATKTLANQTASVARPLAEQVDDLREEVDMLWWYIGGWSRELDCPFSELHPAVLATMAGMDMANLSRTLLGPAAAPAILRRVLNTHAKEQPPKVLLRDVLSGLDQKSLERIDLAESLATVPDICPILTAFAKAKEIGVGTDWHASYVRVAGLALDAEIPLADLSMQVFREAQLLCNLD